MNIGSVLNRLSPVKGKYRPINILVFVLISFVKSCYSRHTHFPQFHRREDFFSELSPCLRNELTMSLNGKTVKGLALFAGFPEALVVDIVNCLRFSICLQYDVVMLEGQIGHSMFFVRAGSCQVIFLRDPSNIIAELGVGSHFGEIAMVAPVGKNIRTSTVVTAEKCELNELCRPDLMMCLENYPTERMAFFDVSVQS